MTDREIVMESHSVLACIKDEGEPACSGCDCDCHTRQDSDVEQTCAEHGYLVCEPCARTDATRKTYSDAAERVYKFIGFHEELDSQPELRKAMQQLAAGMERKAE